MTSPKTVKIILFTQTIYIKFSVKVHIRKKYIGFFTRGTGQRIDMTNII